MKQNGYVPVKQLALDLGLNDRTLLTWEKEKFIYCVEIDGVKSVSKAIAQRLVEVWNSTCTPTEAWKSTGTNRGLVYFLINVRIIRSIQVNGLLRVYKTSLPVIVEHSKVNHATRVQMARLREGSFFEKLNSKLPAGLGSAISMNKAAKVLGVAPMTIARWVKSDLLKMQNGKVLVSSIEPLRNKLKKDFGLTNNRAMRILKESIRKKHEEL